MSDSKTKPDQKKTSASTDDNPNPELQQAWDEANEKGYFGIVPDETPNADYTVAGVTKAAKGGK